MPGSQPDEESEGRDDEDGLDGDDGDEDLGNPPAARLPPEEMVPQLVSFGPAASLSFEQVQQRLAGDHEPADGEVPTLVIRRDAPPPVAPKARVRRAVVAPPAPTAPEIPHFARGPAMPPSPLMVEALKRLKDTFHIKGLRPGQAEIIESVLAGRDTLAVMPTGSGKSLTYQLPSMVLPGPTLVVSPLLALIEDQVSKLKKLGVPVARIDSTRTAKERAADLESVRQGKIRLVFITPESVCSPAVQNALEGVKFSLFAVDEAHCVSQWGHDFRPSYLGLKRAVKVLGRPPVLGLTATATPAIGDDVLVQLGMKDANVCRVSFHRPNLAFDVRKVAGEADKLRQLGKLIQRLRRPGIVYCATVRAVDDLYVALRHGKIPVERYTGKMTTEEREASQTAFMTSGRKIVMLATNAFGLGIDKPDIRYIIHYQMPGSPEAYVQEAGRAGRDGQPARCVLLFQPDDIDIQEHFLKEAHPTKTQARMVAEGLYAWSDEGKEVSVRDLALSMALPERRVRVVLSVLEAMGVAEEVKAARWKGVDPKPSRDQIDKAASVFEARRISDRRRLASLLGYMNTQSCRVQMMRAYFGEPEGALCGLCDSCAGLDSEVFDTGEDDERYGLHAATDFHGRKRRRKRGEKQRPDVVAPPAAPLPPPPPMFESVIPEILPPLAPFEIPAPAESEAFFDPAIWDEAVLVPPSEGSREGGSGCPGEPIWEDSDSWMRELAAAPEATLEANPEGGDFEGGWVSVRDATIRSFTEWKVNGEVVLPTMPRPALNRPQHAAGGHWHPSGGGGPRPPGGPGNGSPGGPNRGASKGPSKGSGHGPLKGSMKASPEGDRGRRRRRKRGGNGNGGGGGGGGSGGGRPSSGVPRDRDRFRERGPRLPGVYNPGGD